MKTNQLIHASGAPISTITIPEEYQRDGYFVVNEVLTRKECKTLIETAHEFPSYKNKDFVPEMNVHLFSPAFLSTMKKPEILERVKQMIQSDSVSGIGTEMFYCKPGTQGFNAHQDNYFVQANISSFCSVWIALEDVSKANGTLAVYPGSHKEGILSVEECEDQQAPKNQDPNARRTRISNLPKKYKPLDVEVPAGSAIFFHSCLVHSSNDNETTNRFRHALLLTYLKTGESFRPGHYARRTALKLTP